MAHRPALPTREEAETLAIRAVGFLADRPDLFRRFLGLSGLTVEDVRGRLADPALLGAVLDFILFDEALTRELAAEVGVAPDMPVRARRQLPGAAEN